MFFFVTTTARDGDDNLNCNDSLLDDSDVEVAGLMISPCLWLFLGLLNPTTNLTTMMMIKKM